VPTPDGDRFENRYSCAAGAFSLSVISEFTDVRIDLERFAEGTDFNYLGGATVDLHDVTGDRDVGLLSFVRRRAVGQDHGQNTKG